MIAIAVRISTIVADAPLKPYVVTVTGAAAGCTVSVNIRSDVRMLGFVGLPS